MPRKRDARKNWLLESGSWCRVLQLLKSDKIFALVFSIEKWPIFQDSWDDFKSTKLFAGRLTMGEPLVVCTSTWNFTQLLLVWE